MVDRLNFEISAPGPTASGAAARARQRRAAARAVEAVQCLLEESAPEDLETISSRMERALAPREVPESREALIADLTGGREYGWQERAALEMSALVRSFRRRRELLEGSLTAPQVGELLGTSRQTPHDRARSDNLLAVLDRGILRFPAWQFDPEGPDGVLEGLPDVLRVLCTSPLARVNWFVLPNPYLEGLSPIEALKRGEVEEVVRTARAVGVS